MAIPIQEEDLDGDGLIVPGETAPVMQTTSAPAPTPTPVPQPAPAAPGATPPPAASNVPPWLANMRAAQDKRIADWRGGTDAFFGGLGKLFEGDLKGGFGQWRDYADDQRDARRAAMDERMAKMGDRFKMPHGFASKLPWGQSMGKPGHWGQRPGKPGKGGAQGVAPGEPNPSAPKDPSLDTPKEGGSKPARGAWWAQGGGWGGGYKGRGKPAAKPAAPAANPVTPATSSTPTTPEEDDEP